jgi:hypothetical protein
MQEICKYAYCIYLDILLDAPESILVILGAIALYDFTKETSPKDASI